MGYPRSRIAGAEKIDYLIALHATLIGTGRRDEYGLSALEENLLGRAIRQVYERSVVTGERPRELLLQETLTARAASEAEVGAGQMADALRDLAARLHNFCRRRSLRLPRRQADDRPAGCAARRVRHPSNSRLTSPGPAMFEIVEHVAERVARNVQRHLRARRPPARGLHSRRRAPRYHPHS